MDFCKAFNARTKNQEGVITPVVITVFADRSFTFITKTPPVSILLKQAAGVNKGSAEPNREKVGKVSIVQVEEIAKQKMPDLNAINLEGAVGNSLKAPPEVWALRSDKEIRSSELRLCQK